VIGIGSMQVNGSPGDHGGPGNAPVPEPENRPADGAAGATQAADGRAADGRAAVGWAAVGWADGRAAVPSTTRRPASSAGTGREK
jgi:hypothetical protein